MHSALRPYVTSGLAIVGSSVIALAPLAPPASAPAQGAAVATKQVTQDVTLSARVVTINPSPDALEMSEQLKGTVCGGGGTPCYELDYLPIWTGPGEFGHGVEALKEALAADPDEDTTIFGFSEGAVVASQWLAAHLEDPEAYPAPANLTFIVIGNPSRKYGGSGTVWGQTWPEDSGFNVIDVAQQYDPTVDMPSNPFNVLASLNATMGFFTNHLGNGYKDVVIDDAANSRWEEDGVEYVFVPSKNLPLLEPLRWAGLNKLADDLTGPMQYLIEQAYDRDDRIKKPVVDPDARNPFYAPINLFETIANIPYYAVQGTNRFANAMRASGSWWVYTPVNVLGWDPANPEMTRAFVDFLVAIPSISGPMGEIADYWARANLPMNAGCTGFPPCPDPGAITDQMFKVMLWDLFNPEGFTFEGPITPQYNPISDVEAYWGQELGLTGDEVEWYGETIHLDPFAETKSFWDHLQSTPEGIKTPTLQQQIDAFKNLADGLMTTWNPFVPKSYVWNPKMTPFAYLARPFAKLLCPTCNAVDPFMPADWKVGRDIYPGAYIPPSVKDLYDPETGKYIGDPIPGVTDVPDSKYDEESGLGALRDGTTETEEAEEDASDLSVLVSNTTSEDSTDDSTAEDGAEKKDVMSTAVQNLLDKFGKAPAEEAPATETPAEETPADEAPEAPVDEDADEQGDGKTETGTPTEPKDETPAAGDETDADETDADKGESETPKPEKPSKAETKKAEKAEKAEKSEAKSSETSTKDTKKDTKDTAKESSASKSTGSSGSGGGGTDG